MTTAPAVPPTSRPQRLLREGLVAAATRHPHKTAVIVEGEAHDYGELYEAARRLAAWLVAGGLQRGDRVAIYMDNTWPCIVSIYATLLAGSTFLLVNPQTKADKLRYILGDSGARALLSDWHLAPVLKEALEGPEQPALRLLSGENRRGLALPGPEPAAFDTVIADTLPLESPVQVIPSDLAALIYTSGSTGDPKGVMQTHQSMVFAAWSLIEYLRLGADDRIMLVLPMAFDYGLYQLLMSVKLGATLIVERSFTFPARIYQRMQEEEVTVFPGVPTIFSMMAETHRRTPLCFPSVRRVTNTAAALPPQLVPALREIFPNALIYKMYGLTECKRVCYLEPELLDQRPDSVGKAIPGTEVFLLREDGTPAAPGETGVLHVRGPHVMLGYWNKPEQSAHMLVPGPLPGERVLCTHDLFRMDEEGFLYFVGRTDDIIKTRGEKVSPLEVERTLLDLDGIAEAAVFGIPDPQLGEVVCACVSLTEGAELGDREIKRHCLARLENFMVPGVVHIRDALPRSPNGKIDRRRLREEVLGND